MPLETDLKKAYALLYDQKLPLAALKLYDTILKDNPDCIPGLLYKAATLEKLYFGYADWHSDITLENSVELLERALKVAQRRGDMSKLGFVYFRFFVHWFNVKKYDLARTYFDKARECKYDEKALEMWEFQLNRKPRRSNKNKKEGDGENVHEPTVVTTVNETADTEHTSTVVTPQVEPKPEVVSEPETNLGPKFRTDWYQTPKTVTIVIYTQTLPESVSDVQLQLRNNRTLTVTYPIRSKGSEFQYSVKLAGRVADNGTSESRENGNSNGNGSISCHVFSKKLEITLQKLDTGVSWHALEYVETRGDEQREKEKARVLKYPSSSKNATDWSRIGSSGGGNNGDDDDDEDAGSADAFFRKLYKNADADTRRAMMKSYIESNGTALNTSWEDVKDKVVETVPPEGMELKHY